MSTAYIALGSNVGDRLRYLRSAKESLSSTLHVTATSSVYDTAPVGSIKPDRYLNAVLAAETELPPEDLLSFCLAIEQQYERVRSVKNAPRTLDIDLLLYGDLSTDTRDLTIPHPRMHVRAFVLAPLADIAPDLVHPQFGVTVRELLQQCGPQSGFVHRTDFSL